MSQTRSGYVIEIPLGLWTQLRFEFETVESDKDGLSVTGAWAYQEDDDRTLPVMSPQVAEIADAYAKSWLLATPRKSSDYYRPQPWVNPTFWGESTLDRLNVLLDEGLVRWEDDLDG